MKLEVSSKPAARARAWIWSRSSTVTLMFICVVLGFAVGGLPRGRFDAMRTGLRHFAVHLKFDTCRIMRYTVNMSKPMVCDETLRRATDDYWRLSAARCLAKTLLKIAGERGLGEGFEHLLWAGLDGEVVALSGTERMLLRALSDECGGWIRWCPTTPRHPLGDEQLAGAEWVGLEAWTKMHGKAA